LNLVSADIVEEWVTFQAGENALEGILAYPDNQAPREAALLLTPHPHLGGRMDNNLIVALAQSLAADGWATLRFNYAGVGASSLCLAEGDTPYEYWSRLEESRNYRAALPDALAAREFLIGALPTINLTYVGYSFGACMAVLLAEQHPPARLIAISPPVSRAPLDGVESLIAPSLFIAGDRDFAFDEEHFSPVFSRIPGAASFVELRGCDHFFRRDETRVYAVLKDWLNGQPAGDRS